MSHLHWHWMKAHYVLRGNCVITLHILLIPPKSSFAFLMVHVLKYNKLWSNIIVGLKWPWFDTCQERCMLKCHLNVESVSLALNSDFMTFMVCYAKVQRHTHSRLWLITYIFLHLSEMLRMRLTFKLYDILISTGRMLDSLRGQIFKSLRFTFVQTNINKPDRAVTCMILNLVAKNNHWCWRAVGHLRILSGCRWSRFTDKRSYAVLYGCHACIVLCTIRWTTQKQCR